MMKLYQGTASFFCRLCVTVLVFICLSGSLSAQKYFFQNYNVEQGLIQSQVMDICQDSTGHLWIATLGGLSRFDGVNFTDYTTKNGLADNYVASLVYDEKGIVWCGTQNGLSRYDGKVFTTIRFNKNPGQNFVSDIASDGKGTIWCIVSGLLYQIRDQQAVTQVLPSGNAQTLYSAIGIDQQGNVWVSAGNMLFRLSDRWEQVQWYQGTGTAPGISVLYPDTSQSILIGTINGVYTLAKDKKAAKKMPQNITGYVLTICRDKQAALWIGTTSGAYQISNKHTRYYQQQNGFANNAVTRIIQDRENNIWLSSSNGNGLYRYNGTLFTRLDESTGLPNSSVVTFARMKNGNIWMGTYGGGLALYDGAQTKSYTLPDPSPLAKVINSCVVDEKNNVWIGTAGAGFWQFNGHGFNRITGNGIAANANIINVFRDSDSRIWLGTATGVWVYEHGQFYPIAGISTLTSCFIELGKDSILAGTSSGVQLINGKKTVPFAVDDQITKADVKCFVQKDHEIWMGTTNTGIIIWNQLTQQTSLLSSSEFIYFLTKDLDGNIYAGTGRGVQQITRSRGSDQYLIRIFRQSDGLLGLENNQNAVLHDRGGRIWFGTSKGAFLYHPSEELPRDFKPKVVMRQVLLFSEPVVENKYADSVSAWYPIAVNLQLPHKKNNLTFSYQAVSFYASEKIRYQYKIEGLDANWSPTISVASVTYPSLPTGKFVFKVRAVSETGEISPYILEYPFEIITPFYKTSWFQGLGALFLILCGVIMQYLRSKWKLKRNQMLDAIRKEEQNKVRQRTAEDFHDEMGNKLTRISLLTDILKSKIGDEKPELKKLADQIKGNSVELYSGTKDIIWSLNPESDNLYEVLQRVRDFGTDLFHDTSIDFSFIGLNASMKQVYMPLDYSRNLMMIMKESLNNLLKYSAADEAVITVRLINNTELNLKLADNGKGFSKELIRTGHGIDHMYIRAKRINANFRIDSKPGEGTNLELAIKIPPKTG